MVSAFILQMQILPKGNIKMKIKVEGYVDFSIALKILRIDGTKTTWDDLPYQNEKGEWVNKDKMFNVVVFWNNDPVKFGERLNAAMQDLMKHLKGEILIS